jgi:probable F420-dependent oxidoreductase
MRIGFTSMNGPRDPRPDVLAGELEARAYDSLWYGEHPHVPVARRTPYPAGGEMPESYRWMMDPFLSLLLAGTATERILLGTGIALPLEHDVFDLAKTVSTLDRLCGGRLLFGVGVGWNEEELANHRSTVPWNRRYAALGECIGALRALWGDDQSEYHGRYYDFDPVWSLPKPIQRPHPPILCGTGGRVGTGHAVAWADGWMPMDISLGDVAGKVGRFREAAADAGRDPGAVPITIVTFGDPTVAALSAHRDLGVERVVIGAGRSGWDDPGTVLPFLDRWAAVIPELAG